MDGITEIQEPQLSLHALTRILSFHTMRIQDLVGTQPVSILVDSGSSHNFLDTKMAKKLGCAVEPVEKLKVAAVNGHLMDCQSVCKGFEWSMQGRKFQNDVLILPLNSYDLILGIQWLSD